jgi:hypothetical protein
MKLESKEQNPDGRERRKWAQSSSTRQAKVRVFRIFRNFYDNVLILFLPFANSSVTMRLIGVAEFPPP